MDIVTLSTTVISTFLLPYAKKGLERIRQEIEEGAEDAVGRGIEKIWSRVKGLFSGSDRERAQWEYFEEEPEAGVGPVAKELEKKLAAEPELAEEIDALVNQPVPGAGGGAVLKDVVARQVGVVDFRGGHASGNATVAGVIVRESASSIDPKDGGSITGGQTTADG